MTAIIDPHIHLWDQRKTPRKASPLVKLLGWNNDLLMWVARRAFPSDLIDFFGKPDHVVADFLEAHYLDDTASRQVTGVVHVQAGWEEKGPLGPVGETRWLESLEMATLEGIVGYADLALGDAAEPVLAAHAAASDRFRGIRYMLANHPDKGVHSFCETAGQSQKPEWRAGYALLARFGLSFDAWCYSHQLGEIHALARDFPEIPIILDHAGSPVGIAGPFAATGHSEAERADIGRRWRDDMQALAGHPHVFVKLSGLAMPALGFGYHAQATPPTTARVVEQLGPLITFVIDTFGADRCMFASNFPVDKAAMPWSTLFDAYHAIVADRPEAERRAMFHDTAVKAYRLLPAGRGARRIG